MEPRIYTYKITFEGNSYFYFGVHKEKKYGEEYWGSPISHKWVWKFYHPEKQILEVFHDWEEAKEVENRIIAPFLNDPLCLNEAVGFKMSLSSCSKGGKQAQKVLKKKKAGFYGPKTQAQLESSLREGKKLRKYSAENGRRAGIDNVNLKRGMWGWDSETRKENSSKAGKIGGKVTGSQKWIDPDHPELGAKPACVLVTMQRKRGYPCNKENRVKLEESNNATS